MLMFVFLLLTLFIAVLIDNSKKVDAENTIALQTTSENQLSTNQESN